MRRLIFLLFMPCPGLLFPAENPREVNQSFYSGYIFAKHPYVRARFFTPTAAGIETAENLLRKRIVAVLASDPDRSPESLEKKKKIAADLHLYKRRYFGIINTVKKRILLIEFVHPDVIRNDTWKSPKWSIDGGGYWFWSLRFNQESGLFYDLWINADLEVKTNRRKKDKKK